MTYLLIDPLTLQSKGGGKITIRGLDPTSDDCFVGEIVFCPGASKQGCWDRSGIMRGGTHDCNTDPRHDEFRELVKLANMLSHVASC